MTSASIIVRAFNEAKHIGRLLYGCRRQTVDDLDIILVDSGSTDDTVAIARQFDVRVVDIRPEDFSFGRALNRGCDHATSEFLVFASAHVYPVYDDWIERLLAGFKADDIAAVYGKQRGNHVTKFSEQQIFRRWFPDESHDRQATPFCNNANCAVRYSLWKEQPYDEQLTGLEDLHWAKEVMARGYAISYAADAEIIHVHEETPKSIYNRYMREAVAMKRIYEDQSMSSWDFARLFTTNTVADLYEAARQGVLRENIADIPRFRFLQFWGAFDGFQREGPVNEQLKRRFYYPRPPRRGHEDKTNGRNTHAIDYSNFRGPI